MTKLSRAVIVCLSATMMLTGVASSARANTFFYFLDNNTLADANGGPSLVSYGGTLSNGYHFGVNEGLSLSGTGAFDVYSIDIHFYFDNVSASFDNVSASFDGYQRILDFKNRTSDSGLYSLNGSLVLFASIYQPGDPSAGADQAAPGLGLRGDGTSHLLILQQLDVEISLGRPCRAGDVAQPGGGEVERGLTVRKRAHDTRAPSDLA
jgi:hypothetical protein